MRVIVVHKLFIGMSIAAALVLAVTRLVKWSHSGDREVLGLGLAALVLIPVMALYLRRIWNK